MMANQPQLAFAAVLLVFGWCLPGARCQQGPGRDTARRQIDTFMHVLSQRGQFSGAVLVGDTEGILYEAGFNQANRAEAMPFSTQTQSCLASVSKPFTALAVMMQVQSGSMRLDDPIERYVAGLKSVVGAVTIRQLLTHTSGIPDYGNTPVDHPGATTAEVLTALRSIDRLEFPSGERYQYSNSGYVLLGAAVSAAAKMPFPQFLRTRIFAPVGMNRTFLLEHHGQKTPETAVGYNDFGDVDDYAGFVDGDGGMYSTVEDLYRFDRALYSNMLVSPETFARMITPATVREGRTSYAFGWNVESTPGGERMWHTGSTAGFRAYFERRVAEHRVIILLTNEGNSKRVEISTAINNILDNKPFVYPKRSGVVELDEAYRASGAGAVLQRFRSLKQILPGEYDLNEADINELGYRVLYTYHNATDAVKVFALNTSEHPSSSNAFDSLAEAYEKSGDLKAAKSNYQKALALDSTNEHARSALVQMK